MTGILLINLGTPDEPTVPAVRRYLRQFLSDPLVIDIHPVARWLLVNLIIAPFRSRKSTEAYKKIWTERGSPLKFHTEDLARALQARLREKYAVAYAMRYGRPTIEEGIKELLAQGAQDIRVLPLYPQYASSSTESSIREVFEVTGRMKLVPPLEIIPPFYSNPGFIESWAVTARPVLQRFNPDFVLFSFHGLPERHITRLDKTQSHCLKKPDCCEKMVEANEACYRAHSFETARLIKKNLDIKVPTEVSFQSRLGRTPWIKPYTDHLLAELPRRGVKRLVVFSPSFVADCLETLEEIAIRGREIFMENGGEALELVPSLNATPHWVLAVEHLVTQELSGSGCDC